ncbi:hypothetical protein [Bacillus thuringiensis]|uniref:hypothetical protein n=1 Tax=Bacillus thuringiensis TaxID=1428 RepID=UPI0021D69A66|nr:hypothetical protein [Bacillus thuringiensis]MCU7676261.1 hypothetical protein [Bacillus thuringiensis]
MNFYYPELRQFDFTISECDEHQLRCKATISYSGVTIWDGWISLDGSCSVAEGETSLGPLQKAKSTGRVCAEPHSGTWHICYYGEVQYCHETLDCNWHGCRRRWQCNTIWSGQTCNSTGIPVI